MSWFKQIKQGLQKSSEKFTTQLQNVFTNKVLDDEIIEQLEETLISADINIKVVNDIVQKFRKQKFSPNITLEEASEKLAIILEEILIPYAKSLDEKNDKNTLQLIIFCGVNGNGKTTTVGKLSAQYQQNGKKVLIAACDTYRAAAISQLEIWSKRANATLFTGKENADPASVAYGAVQKAIDEKYDYLLLDTAGRLHNHINLMQELTKIVNISDKFNYEIDKKIILVLDATTGQNAYSQIELFNNSVKLSGVIVTKLDSSAKAGVVIGIAGKYHIPIFAIGVGEKIDDLQAFSARDFVSNLLNIQ